MSATRLRVATFNIRNGRAFDGRNSWPLRRRATLEAIKALDADVIGLQEAFGFQLRWLARHLPDYAVFGAGRTNGRRGEHTAVLVRAPLRSIADRTSWFTEGPGSPGERLKGARFPRGSPPQ